MDEISSVDVVFGVLFQGIKCLKRVEDGDSLILIFGFENLTNQRRHWGELSSEIFEDTGENASLPLWELVWTDSSNCNTSTTNSLSAVGDLCLGLLNSLLADDDQCTQCKLSNVPEGITLLDYLNFFNGSETIH